MLGQVFNIVRVEGKFLQRSGMSVNLLRNRRHEVVRLLELDDLAVALEPAAETCQKFHSLLFFLSPQFLSIFFSV